MMCYSFFAMKTAVIVACLAAAAAPAQDAPRPVVVFETAKGAIEIEVDIVRAPITGANFLKYVDGRFYDGGVVNRAVRPDNTTRHDVEIQVIQFQSDRARRQEQFAPIPLERTKATGLTHLDGAVSMARAGPDTAQASFSIVIGDQPEMDFGGKRNPDGQGFAVFGRVVKGMDVVKAIQASPTGEHGAYGTETLQPPVAIVKAYRRVSGALLSIATHRSAIGRARLSRRTAGSPPANRSRQTGSGARRLRTRGCSNPDRRSSARRGPSWSL
jgi:peptidyl-prolyl cis-trans isomerase A (cyclophilin A)